MNNRQIYQKDNGLLAAPCAMAAKEISSTTSSGLGKCSSPGVSQREKRNAAKIARCSTSTTTSSTASQNNTLRRRLYGLVTFVPIASSSIWVSLLTAVAPVTLASPDVDKPVLVTTRRWPGSTPGRVPFVVLLSSVLLVS